MLLVHIFGSKTAEYFRVFINSTFKDLLSIISWHVLDQGLEIRKTLITVPVLMLLTIEQGRQKKIR